MAGYVSVGGQSDFAVARYLPNGTLDTSFGTGGKVITALSPRDDVIHALAVQPDGKVVVAGYSRDASLTQNYTWVVARYTASGALDASSGTGGTVTTAFRNQNIARSVVIQPDGKILAAGFNGEQTIDGPQVHPDFAVVRYNPDGRLDASFGGGGVRLPPSARVTTGLSPWPSTPRPARPTTARSCWRVTRGTAAIMTSGSFVSTPTAASMAARCWPPPRRPPATRARRR